MKTTGLEDKAKLSMEIFKTCKHAAKGICLKCTMDSQNNSRQKKSLIRKWAKAIKTFKQLGNISGKWVLEKSLELKYKVSLLMYYNFKYWQGKKPNFSYH